MGKLHGTIADATSGEVLEAKVHVLSSNGRFLSPQQSIMKVGPGRPFFYCPGEFTLDAPRGPTDILVERGTEYKPLRKVVNMPPRGVMDVELHMERWTDLPSMSWYPGNTHIHYDEKEARPNDRLHLDPKVHDFSVTVVSILQRRELPYASNKFPIGVFTEYSTAHHVVDIGEENRHNAPWEIGYGHVMFLRIQNIVDPVSRGMLVSDFDPDYPPLCFACDDARDQGGLVLWCHNGRGMEAPVAAALGKLDGFNLFDPYWMDPEYDLWYKLLNCGLELPASSGSDWFVCSNNRVYVQTEGAFSYDTWLEHMKRGRTFITNGPALFIHGEGLNPGDHLSISETKTIEVEITWQSHYPINRVELIQEGAVAQVWESPEGSVSGAWQLTIKATRDSWIAARCSGTSRDSFDQAVYAHTSPIYIQMGRPPASRKESAEFFIRSIDDSLGWVRKKGRFTQDQQREEVVELFLKGRAAYERIAREG